MSRQSPDLRAAAVPTLTDVARVASVSPHHRIPHPGPARGAQAGRAAGQPQLGLTGYDPRQEAVLLAAAPSVEHVVVELPGCASCDALFSTLFSG